MFVLALAFGPTLGLVGCDTPGDDGSSSDESGVATPADPYDCATLAASLAAAELGTGSTTFMPLPIVPGQSAPLKVIQGPQGGFHVWGSVRTQNLHPGLEGALASPPNPVTQFRLQLADGSIVGDTGPISPALRQRADGQVELVGEVVPLFIDSIDTVVWQTGTLSLSLTDSCGRSVSDARLVNLVP